MSGSNVPAPERVEVAGGLFAYVQPDGGWMLNNTGIITSGAGDDEAVLVDTTSTEARNRALLASVAQVAPGPPRALINTHHHGDHTYGNWLLPARTPIIGHTTCREDVLAAGTIAAQILPGPDYGHIEIRPPDVTFDGSMTLHLGERRIELLHAGPAHTRSDVLVWLPAERVLYAGDIAFAGGQPFLVEGSVSGYPRALATIRGLMPEILVPGHGPVCRGDEVGVLLDDLDAYAAYVAALAGDGHAAGRGPLETVRRAEPSRFDGWQESERLVGNLHRAYLELDGAAEGAKIDLGAVWTEMVEYHGGPIRCFA
jgi:cyclase